MKRKLFIFTLSVFLFSLNSAKADFGDADFPIGTFKNSPQSYHDAWCRSLGNKCRVRFQGSAMWVEGQGGIRSSQYIRYRYDADGLPFGGKGLRGGFSKIEHYNYVTYLSKNGQQREALFIFANDKAHANFVSAFMRWRRQESQPVPNYKLPANQGPQDSQGKDKGLNPYENSPIQDWSIDTTKKGKRGNINCDSPVWSKRDICN